MMPEKEELIDDLFGDDARRQTVLFAGARVLRRRRYWRVARRSLALAALAATAFFWLTPREPRQNAVVVPSSPAKTASAIEVHALTDDELLALFPNTPVGLVTLADGKKRLIFPRPGDERRLINHL